jgi:23S rRNA (cytidine1920-2'-O)/16S rRNA (cytidine1409-2'-O)-methyltransferase
MDGLGIEVDGHAAADFGCHVGGFTDCLLQAGASRVYAVDTGYGILAWELRQDERVVVMERTNAMHVQLPEPVDLVTIDVGWTKQKNILPNALLQSKPDGRVLSLFKPQYEAPPQFVRDGVIQPDKYRVVLEGVLRELEGMGVPVRQVVELPREREGKNPEAFLYVRCSECAVAGPGDGEE